jgi:inner membrane protease subunit 1
MPPPRLRIPSLLFSRLHSSSTRSPILRSSTFRPTFPRTVLITFKLFILGHLFVSYIGTIGPTEGISMVPTIPHSEISRPWILESHLQRRGRNIRVGDVITFTHPVRAGEMGCKRVIGMPGDYVSVVTPGRERDEDMDKAPEEGDWGNVRREVVRVPEGHCWVAGDNWEWSRDSRNFGPLPLALVKGRAVGIVWPPREWSWLGNGVEHAKGVEREWVLK